MKKTLMAMMVACALVLLPAGCGGDDEGTVKDKESAATVDAEKTDGGGDGGGATVAVPADFDFQGTGMEFVAAASAGDCDTFADLQGWTETKDSKNRETSISNCGVVKAEMDGIGETTKTTARQEVQTDGDVTVWVTREYADGAQWEMMMVFREKKDKGWVVSTFAHGMKQQAD